jgi:hypothetical protein
VKINEKSKTSYSVFGVWLVAFACMCDVLEGGRSGKAAFHDAAQTSCVWRGVIRVMGYGLSTLSKFKIRVTCYGLSTLSKFKIRVTGYRLSTLSKFKIRVTCYRLSTLSKFKIRVTGYRLSTLSKFCTFLFYFSTTGSRKNMDQGSHTGRENPGCV